MFVSLTINVHNILAELATPVFRDAQTTGELDLLSEASADLGMRVDCFRVISGFNPS